MGLTATVEYDGSVFINGVASITPINYLNPVRLGLANEYRGKDYPVEQFNGSWIIRFPFGVYYLE